MAGDAEVRLAAAQSIGRARTVRVQSAALRSSAAAVTSRSRSLRSSAEAVMSRSQALRSRPVDDQALVTRRDRAAAPVFVSPASIRARVTLTYRELATATRRQAIARARELGLLDG